MEKRFKITGTEHSMVGPYHGGYVVSEKELLKRGADLDHLLANNAIVEVTEPVSAPIEEIPPLMLPAAKEGTVIPPPLGLDDPAQEFSDGDETEVILNKPIPAETGHTPAPGTKEIVTPPSRTGAKEVTADKPKAEPQAVEIEEPSPVSTAKPPKGNK